MKHSDTSYPIFHPDEKARINWYAYDERVRGQLCTVKTVMKPVAGVNRYGVRCENGMYTISLEPTLQKRFERSDWGMLRGIWQPRREAR